jgi:hypothetical protein
MRALSCAIFLRTAARAASSCVSFAMWFLSFPFLLRAGASLSGVFTAASYTSTRAIAFYMYRGSSEQMPMGTMRLGSADSYWTNSAQHVLAMTDDFKVRWIHAMRIPAEMVKGTAGRDAATEQTIRNAVSLFAFARCMDLTIAPVCGTEPLPATVLRNHCHLVHESIEQVHGLAP